MASLNGIDICERARDALAAAGMDDVHVRRLDALTGREGVVVRLMPSRTVRSYYDGTRDVACTFQALAKYRDALRAMNAVDEVAEVLRHADLSSANGSYSLAGQPEQQGYPEEVAVAEDGMHVWAARFSADITV